ncbi:MAG: DNA-binding MarR family transcriptional regulator [Nitrospinales bacterium]|jgi:DNA-binding MarR family transcriptional regulator
MRGKNFRNNSSSPIGTQMSTEKNNTSSWTFLTNHAHVLMRLAKNPSERIRDLAVEVGITERAVQRIIVELEADGYMDHIRDGRRNVYKVFPRKPLRHGIEKHRQVHDLIQLINK